MRSKRSSSGARFHRAHFGQTTHSRPFHSSNASRFPTPRPDGPPSPARLPLQKAQVLYITSHVAGHTPHSLGEALHPQRSDVDVGRAHGEQVGEDLAAERRQQDAVAAATGWVITAGSSRTAPRKIWERPSLVTRES